MNCTASLRIRALTASLLLAAIAAIAGFVVCPKCGYENNSALSACTHCRGELPGVRTAPPAPLPEPESVPRRVAANLNPEGYLDPRLVEREVAMAKDHFRQGNVEIGRLLLRNAAALDLLTDPHEPSKRSEEILKLLSRCDSLGASVKRRCPACAGTGKGQARLTGLDGRVDFRDVPGKACGQCKGTGSVRGTGTVSDRKFNIGRAMNRYGTIQQGKKFVPIGGTWVPGDVEEDLTIRQTVQLKRACPAPCEECLGVGRSDCEECKALARVKCGRDGCENGMVRVVNEGTLVKARVSRTEKCRECRGRAFVACGECVGRGSVLCEECGGTGERKLCPKCGGQGLASCRRCNGSGKYRDEACSTCGEQGISLCSSCSGDGRKR
jgi:hypothetical protein